MDDAVNGRGPVNRVVGGSFQWVSSSPTPAEVELLEARFPEVIQVPVAELEAEAEGWLQRAALVRTFHRWVPAEAIIREFRRGGIPGEISSLSLSFKCHIIQFENSAARDSALLRPWVVNGQALASEEWRPEFIPANDSIHSALLWIRMPNLPVEFWREEILREIIAPAGEFQFADSATLSKNRGGFARVCARVDLRSPLRPGARVQGLQGTFWQQFAFEHLEGICSCCGSMHLSGSCSSSAGKEAGAMDCNPLFGPWIVAVRQRKPVMDFMGAFKGKKVMEDAAGASVAGIFNGASSSALKSKLPSEGWSTPTKYARRRNAYGPKQSKHLDGLSGQRNGNAKGNAVNQSESVPATVHCAGETENTENSKLKLKAVNGPQVVLNSKNPFAVLDLDAGGVTPMEALSGSLKRARPAEVGTPRSISKVENRKGKGCNSKSNSKNVNRSSTETVSVSQGSHVVSLEMEQVEVMVQPILNGSPSGDLLVGRTMDQEVGIQYSETHPQIDESSVDMICSSPIPEGDSNKPGSLTGSVMVEGQGVGPVSFPF